MQQIQVTQAPITRVDDNRAKETDDTLAVEEPLEIRISYHDGAFVRQKSISVTMRTPGHDFNLAAGFLFTEGIIKSKENIHNISIIKENTVFIEFAPHVLPDIGQLERNFYTTSSCGVCGKASIGAVKTACSLPETYPYDNLKYTSDLICSLPDILRAKQSVFDQTGGIHACALFNNEGALISLREDIGRHNALDKLVGEALMDGLIPLGNHILLLSGRASFELIQKAAMAGIKIVAAVGAPSSLAVQMAEDWNITLIGFLRGRRFNIYSGGQRVVI